MKATASVMPIPRVSLPKMARARQNLASAHIADVRGDVQRKLLASGLNGLGRGSRVAVTAGSRGIGAFVELLAGAADAVKSVGGEPFVIPAMGSHGGATAEGQ